MNIRVDMNTPIKDGTEVVFRSPVDCSQITGLIVYHKGDDGNTASTEFALADAHGNNVGDIDHLFAENVAVKVILDVTKGMAFVQNADTNSYLEGRFNGLSDSIICSSSGETISVSDASNRALQNLAIYGKTTQNGTPTPTVPVEIESVGNSGSITVNVTGKNLLPFPYEQMSKTQNGLTFTVNADGSVTVTGTATGNAYLLLASNIDFGEVSLDGRVRINKPTNGIYTASKRVYYNASAKGVSLEFDPNDGFGGNETFYPQIEVGTVATAYEPYKCQSLTLPTPTGLHGIGSRNDQADLATGETTQHWGSVTFDGSDDEVWRTVSGSSAAHLNGTFHIPLADMPSGGDGVCSHFARLHSTTADGTFWKSDVLYFRNDAISGDLTAWRAWLAANPVTLVYQLTAPAETAIDSDTRAAYAALHTNYPNTTITADGAGIAVTYVADTKNYIDNKFTELQNAIHASGANV